ncbi:hypothetical protein BST61_g2444 [Cercospora zeina]
MSSDHTKIVNAARSEAILCLVGVAKTRFFVHRALLNSEDGGPSCPIKVISDRESSLPVRIKYVDAGTLSPYIEYLYTGDHTAAESNSRLSSYACSASE